MKENNLSNGFTLIEIMVAVSIFVIVALIVSGAFLTLSDIYRKVESNRAIVDNLNFAIDTIALQVRSGINYSVDDSCGVNCFKEFSFDETYIVEDLNILEVRRNLTYKLSDHASGGQILQCVEGSSGCQSLTSEEIDVRDMKFYLIESSSRPRVLLSMEGIARNKQGLETEFVIQTTLFQRNIQP